MQSAALDALASRCCLGCDYLSVFDVHDKVNTADGVNSSTGGQEQSTSTACPSHDTPPTSYLGCVQREQQSNGYHNLCQARCSGTI